jgi:PsbN protein
MNYLTITFLLKKSFLKFHFKNQFKFKIIIMESTAFFFCHFVWCFLLSITGYSLYVGFGPPSKQLRDPFEEHED